MSLPYLLLSAAQLSFVHSFVGAAHESSNVSQRRDEFHSLAEVPRGDYLGAPLICGRLVLSGEM